MTRDSIYTLPDSLAAPVNDGACDHLPGMPIPSISLPSTSGNSVNLAAKWLERSVVYCYPRTGLPDEEPPGGTAAWNVIPGARGCTPESCAFRDHFHAFQSIQAAVFGLSSQTSEYQREMVQRLRLPFEVLSDSTLAFAKALRLPTFQVDSEVLIKRLTLIIEHGIISKVFYPIFPPDKHAEEVVEWLCSKQSR